MADIIDKPLDLDDLTEYNDDGWLWWNDNKLRLWCGNHKMRLYYRDGALADVDAYIDVGVVARNGILHPPTGVNSADVNRIVSLPDEKEYEVIKHQEKIIAVAVIDDIDPQEYHQTTPPHEPRDPRERGHLS